MEEALIIPVVAILMPLVLVPTIITLKHRHKRREWKYQERLRAMDLGLQPVDSGPRLSGGSVVAIGAGVPIASVIGAIFTTLSVPYHNPDYLPIIAVAWGCAVIISTAALLTSLVLGVLVMRASKAAQSADALASLKPSFEPDAYDVVSRRG
jgi:hypothetical protein